MPFIPATSRPGSFWELMCFNRRRTGYRRSSNASGHRRDGGTRQVIHHAQPSRSATALITPACGLVLN